MKRVKIIIAVCTIFMLGSSLVYAGTSSVGYSTTVGKVNGSGYTAYQTKTTTGANGSLRSDEVGGKYTVDARMQDRNGIIGAWTYGVNDNKTYTLKGHINQKKDYGIRVQFSNDLNTFVNVQVEGSFKGN